MDFQGLQIPEPLTDITPKTILDGIVGPRIEELYNCIGQEIEKSGLGKQIPSGLVLTGGGALTIGMPEMGKKILGLPIRVGKPEKAVGLVDEIMDPQFSTTVGLVYYGMKNTEGDGGGTKDFNKILKDISMPSFFTKIKQFFQQFLP
jgi:cell division protein FtsA